MGHSSSIWDVPVHQCSDHPKLPLLSGAGGVETCAIRLYGIPTEVTNSQIVNNIIPALCVCVCVCVFVCVCICIVCVCVCVCVYCVFCVCVCLCVPLYKDHEPPKQ